MKLSDQDILELTELGNALLDKRITDAQRERLADLLRSSEEARRFHVQMMGLAASLGNYAAEMQTAPRDAAKAVNVVAVPAWRWATLALAAAACVALGLFILRPIPNESESTKVVVPAEPPTIEYVARLSATRDCLWADHDVSLKTGTLLARGRMIDLLSGHAEVTFDCGATILLEGPSKFEITSAWDGQLHRGTLKANVPQQAVGFRITHPSVEVVDLGTEFSMIADATGNAEVFVLKGSVEAVHRNAASPQPVVLKEKQARRFSRTGMAEVRDRENKFKRLARNIALDRLTESPGVAHWSFDSNSTGEIAAQTANLSDATCEGTLESTARITPASTYTDGRWQQSLHFDGHLAVRASFPGMNSASARTVAFWTRVPEDSPLTDAGGMMAWKSKSKKPSAMPVQISWNRNPAQGSLGALRTEHGRGFVVGTSPLRDGRWHHVAVVFVPASAGEPGWQIKQYVDGRLEGVSSGAAGRKRPAQVALDSTDERQDQFWLGRHIAGAHRVKDRFRGDLDELFVIDRALTPGDIVHLMDFNRLPDSLAKADISQ